MKYSCVVAIMRQALALGKDFKTNPDAKSETSGFFARFKGPIDFDSNAWKAVPVSHDGEWSILSR